MLPRLVRLAALPLLSLTLPASDPPGAARPNVVLIIADDQAWTDYGFMGHGVIRTPRLDALAQQSVLFPRGYVPTALCRPSLMSMVTGLYPHQHGITGNDPPPGVARERMLAHIDRLDTVPERLAAAGYRCLQTGKWWEGGFARGGFTHGMTHGDPTRGGRHGDDGLRIGRRGLQPIFDFIEADATAPFLVWYAPFLPHTPHNPPDRLLAKYRAGRSLHLARYYAMCEWLDETCGELLDYLDRRQLADDTIVLFVADNGWIQRPDRQGYAPFSKRSPNEGGVRTPILVRWPGTVAPIRCETPVSSVDLAPTILRACGVGGAEDLPGVDLLAVARGEVDRGPVFGAAFTHDAVDVDDPAASLLSSWVVDGKDKLTVPAAPATAPRLHDVTVDPAERFDLAGERPGRVVELHARIAKWWPGAAHGRQPNILLLLTDDQRADALGCAGHPVLQTPNMDALAAAGIRFRNAFVTTSICAASRASILTSAPERTHGYTFGTPPLRAELTDRSFPRLLRDAGYRTGFVGKFGVRVTQGATAAMYDVFEPLQRTPYVKQLPDGSTRHLTDIAGDRAVEFLRRRDTRPFCLQLSFHAPHAEDGDPRQYVWPEQEDGLYEDAVLAEPPSSGPEFFAALPRFQRESMNRERWFWRFDTPEKRVEMTKGYYRMISGVDRVIGRVLQELRRQSIEDNTVVVLTSDNGYFLGERGFAGKWLIHEPSLRVPLIVFDPRAAGFRRGTLADPMVLNLDLAPTILAWAGVEPPPDWLGRSLVPLLAGQSPPWRTAFRYEHLLDHPKIPKSRGVRTLRWSYARYFEQDPVFEELYDLRADPLQEHNLATDPARAAVLQRLRAQAEGR